MKKISFDFDNTIAMAYMTYEGEQPIPVFKAIMIRLLRKSRNISRMGMIFTSDSPN